jgi:hypothetical protein
MLFIPGFPAMDSNGRSESGTAVAFPGLRSLRIALRINQWIFGGSDAR